MPASAHLHRLEGSQTEWKAALWSVPALLYALFKAALWSVPALLYALCFLIYTLFVLVEQECGLCRYVLRTALLCTPTLSVKTRLWNIGEAAVAVESAQAVTTIHDYFTLCHYYCDFFLIIRIIP
jgi:hypothetical protein